MRTFDALGYQFAVSCTNDVSADQVWAALEGLATDADVAGLDEFVVGGSTGGSTMTLERLVGLINLRSLVALQAGNLVLHSGAVCAPTGATVLLCGPSGSGKSTLTATLVGRGHAYVTDELVCLSPDLVHITPFRKPLSLKPGAHALLPHLRPSRAAVADMLSGDVWLVPPRCLGGPRPPDELLIPEVVVFPTFVSGQSQRVERLGTAEAAYLLGANAAGLGEVRDGGLEAVARVARRVRAYRILHGDPKEAAETIEMLWTGAA